MANGWSKCGTCAHKSRHDAHTYSHNIGRWMQEDHEFRALFGQVHSQPVPHETLSPNDKQNNQFGENNLCTFTDIGASLSQHRGILLSNKLWEYWLGQKKKKKSNLQRAHGTRCMGKDKGVSLRIVTDLHSGWCSPAEDKREPPPAGLERVKYLVEERPLV